MGLFESAPEFLADGAIKGKIRDLITSASEDLLIVSPYLEPTEDELRQLERASLDRRVRTAIIFRKEKMGEYEGKPWYRRLREANVALRMADRLHAKIYMNESAVLLTSMNFHQFSGDNSLETGVVFKKDHAIYGQIEQYLVGLERQIEDAKGFTGKYEVQKQERQRKPAPSAAEPRGHCLRCGGDLPYDPEKPYCREHYQSWAKYENVDYEEQYCHRCGDEYAATMAKPLCRSCFKKEQRA